jgi:hypothetical protein
MTMTCVVLDTNCFLYGNKYYKQIRGGAMGSVFTQLLVNIYMLEWEEHDSIEHQTLEKEFYSQ